MNKLQFRSTGYTRIHAASKFDYLKAFLLVLFVICMSACKKEESLNTMVDSETGQRISEELTEPVPAGQTELPDIQQLLVEPVVIPLMAGQNIEVGTVTVANTEDKITVIYETFDGWSITETHLDIAVDYSGLATNKSGNPVPGKFDYQTSHPDALNEVTYEVDSIDWMAGMELYIATHAVVTSQQGTETAWAGDLEFPGRNWATYFTYVIQEPDNNPQGSLQFSKPVYFTEELGRSNKNLVIIEVERVGGATGTISAVYSIVGGTATNFDDDPDNADYTIESSEGVLEFADGETLKTISIVILDDNDYEFPNETILLDLRESCCLGSQVSTVVDITDDDELN